MNKPLFVIRKSSYRLVIDYYVITAYDQNDAIERVRHGGCKILNETQNLDLDFKFEAVGLNQTQAELFYETSIKANEFFK